MKAVIIFIIILLFPLVVYSECCGRPFGASYMCMDGTWAKGCCGKGKSDFWHPLGACNLFCCDCKGGCIQPTKEGCKKACKNRNEICKNNCSLLYDLNCKKGCQDEFDNCIDSCP